MEEGNVVSLLRPWGRDGTICISTSNTLADQVCLHLAMQMQDNYPITVLQCVNDYTLYFSSAG
jgi:hypothetical protein